MYIMYVYINACTECIHMCIIIYVLCVYVCIYIYIYACVCVSVPAWNIEIPVLDGVSIRSYVWQQEGEVQTNYFTGWYWEV